MNAHAHTPVFRPVNARSATAIDAHIGSRIRLRRQMMQKSQEALGDEVGVTFQQIQKYEKGANRVGGSRLYRAALALDVPVAWFFEGLPGAPCATGTPGGPVLFDANSGILLRHYAAMSPEGQRALQKIATSLVSQFPQEDAA